MLIDGNLTMVYKGWAGIQTAETHLVPASTSSGGEPSSVPSEANNINESVDIGENRELGRGRPLYMVVTLNRDTDSTTATDRYRFHLYTDDSVDGEGDLSSFTNQVGEIQFPGGSKAGDSQWIALTDGLEQFLQLRVSASGITAREAVQFEAFLSTELPTTTQITRAPYVSYDSYSKGGGYGRRSDSARS